MPISTYFGRSSVRDRAYRSGFSILPPCQAAVVGNFRETADDRVMDRVYEEGNVLGFSVVKISSLKDLPFEVALT
jgi:hypothetical protein